jgi:hypothetical protein
MFAVSNFHDSEKGEGPRVHDLLSRCTRIDGMKVNGAARLFVGFSAVQYSPYRLRQFLLCDRLHDKLTDTYFLRFLC